MKRKTISLLLGMAGDEGKSLDAGMNDPITIPIDLDQLFARQLKWIQLREVETADRQPEDTHEETDLIQQAQAEEELPQSLAGFDLQTGLERLRGNKCLYRKLLLDFGARYTGVADEIRESLKARDLKQAHRLVNNLKGSAGDLAATDLLAAAIEMEKLVKGDKKKPPTVKQLNQKLAALENMFNQVLESVQVLGTVAEDKAIEPSDEELAGIPADLVQDLPQRVRVATEMGNVSAIMTIAEDLKVRSDACAPLSNRSRGEAGETVHHLFMAKLKGYITEEVYQEYRGRYKTCIRMLNGLEKTLERKLPERERRWQVKEEPAILYRNVKELLVNVVKHARASKVSVRLENENSSMKVFVEDDGIGFDPRNVNREGSQIGGFGLFSIEERMADLGGSFKIVSEPGKGSTAILCVPLDLDNNQERN